MNHKFLAGCAAVALVAAACSGGDDDLVTDDTVAETTTSSSTTTSTTTTTEAPETTTTEVDEDLPLRQPLTGEIVESEDELLPAARPIPLGKPRPIDMPGSQGE